MNLFFCIYPSSLFFWRFFFSVLFYSNIEIEHQNSAYIHLDSVLYWYNRKTTECLQWLGLCSGFEDVKKSGKLFWNTILILWSAIHNRLSGREKKPHVLCFKCCCLPFITAWINKMDKYFSVMTGWEKDGKNNMWQRWVHLMCYWEDSYSSVRKAGQEETEMELRSIECSH